MYGHPVSVLFEYIDMFLLSISTLSAVYLSSYFLSLLSIWTSVSSYFSLVLFHEYTLYQRYPLGVSIKITSLLILLCIQGTSLLSPQINIGSCHSVVYVIAILVSCHFIWWKLLDMFQVLVFPSRQLYLLFPLHVL